jgi:hypothetical protein
MTKAKKSAGIRGSKLFTRNLGDGIKLEAQVSPCVFMYDQYPFQVTVILRNDTGDSLGNAYAVDRSLNEQTATEADVSRLLAAVKITPCRCCMEPAFGPSTIETNRNGLCEACFVANLDAELAIDAAAEKRRIADHDQRMKLKGLKVRLRAWIHPTEGGDDYLAIWYFSTRPTDSQIRNILRDEGSSVLDDFQIINL